MARKKIGRKNKSSASELHPSEWPLTGPFEPGRFSRARALEFGPGGGLMVLSHVPKGHPIRQVFHSLFLKHAPRKLRIKLAREGDAEAARAILRDFVELVHNGHITATMPEIEDPPAGEMQAFYRKVLSRRAEHIRAQHAAVLDWVTDAISATVANSKSNALGLKSGKRGAKRRTESWLKKYRAAVEVYKIYKPKTHEDPTELRHAIRIVARESGFSVPVVQRAYHEFIRISAKKPRGTKEQQST